MATTTPDALDSSSYWLGHCEGFGVDSPQGRFGLVEAVMFRMRPDEPDALIVRAGLLARRLVLVPVEDVAEIFPRRERIVLSRVPHESGNDFVTEVCARLHRLAGEGARGTGPAPGAA